jgi:hypothetical protein
MLAVLAVHLQYLDDEATKESSGSIMVAVVVGAIVKASSTTLKQILSMFLAAKEVHTMFQHTNGGEIMELETFGKKERDS